MTIAALIRRLEQLTDEREDDLPIRLDELQGENPCPECGDDTLNRRNVCDECGTCAECWKAERRGYPHPTLCDRHGEEYAERADYDADQRARDFAEDLAVETFLERRRGVI